jgi:uncharacterized membrane protein YkvA (DUF1232 family)
MEQAQEAPRVRPDGYCQKQLRDEPSSRKPELALLQRELLSIWFLLRSRRTPWYSKFIAGGVAAYVLSPVQLIPSFIPVIGLMDDALVLTVGSALIRGLTPEDLISDALAQAQAQTTLRSREQIRLTAIRPIRVAIAACWVALSAFFFISLYRK